MYWGWVRSVPELQKSVTECGFECMCDDEVPHIIRDLVDGEIFEHLVIFRVIIEVHHKRANIEVIVTARHISCVKLEDIDNIPALYPRPIC
jgi:hypothetical protein